MSNNLIGDFISGDSLFVKCTLKVDGVGEQLAGSTIQLVLKPIGVAAPAITISDVVTAGDAAAAGMHTLIVLPDQSLVPPGRYTAFLVRIKGALDRWTFHREQLVVLAGAQ